MDTEECPVVMGTGEKVWFRAIVLLGCWEGILRSPVIK